MVSLFFLYHCITCVHDIVPFSLVATHQLLSKDAIVGYSAVSRDNHMQATNYTNETTSLLEIQAT